MPTEAVWVIITVPRKEYEKELRKLKNQNIRNNQLNISNDFIDSVKQQMDCDSYIEKVLADALEELQIGDVVWVPTRNGNYFQVYFPCDLYENDSILQLLQSKGIGTKSETSIGYIPFNLFFYEEFSDSETEDKFNNNFDDLLPGEEETNNTFDLNHKNKTTNTFKEVTQNFIKSVTSRLTVAQVVEGVKTGAEVTFDFCAYTLMAGFIAAFGLINNDPVNIAASMMIEPIMGTVMAMTFGLVIEDRKLFMLGMKSNIISLLICLISGFIMGLIIFIWMTEWNPPPDGIWPTGEMQSRGTYKGLIYGVLIALPCGGAIAVTLLNNNQAALVGVAVASTFLPPFINTGLLWALSTHIQIRGLRQTTVPFNISGKVMHMKPAYAPQAGYSPIYAYDMRIENAVLGCVSMILTALNIICMLAVAYITLKIKEIVPLDKMAKGTQRFFKQDIKIVRQHNRKSLAPGKDEPVGQQILKEWAEITGLDKNQLLDTSPEARVTQMQTLYDIAQDVEADETYQRVMSHALGNPNRIGLTRRLTQPALYGLDRKKSVAPVEGPAVWNIEQEMSRGMNGRRYTVSPVDKTKDDSNQSSPYSTIGPERGLRPSDLKTERGRRRSSHMLRQSLKTSLHSPYSVWPSNQSRNRSDSLIPGQISGQIPGQTRDPRVRRRTIFSSKLEPHIESTGF